MYDPKPTLVPSALIGSILANLFRKHVARLQDNEKQAESMAFHGTCVQQSLPWCFLQNGQARWAGECIPSSLGDFLPISMLRAIYITPEMGTGKGNPAILG
jgi:hypothetical protein